MYLVLHAQNYYWNGRMSSLVTRVNRRILIIDDTPSVHESFSKALGLPASAKVGLASTEEALFGSAAVTSVQVFKLDSAFQDQETLAKVELALEGNQLYAIAFIDNASPDPARATTLRAIISFARDVGIGMIVEGVQTQEQQTSPMSTGSPMKAHGYCFKAVSGKRPVGGTNIDGDGRQHHAPPPADAATLAIEDSHRPLEVAR